MHGHMNVRLVMCKFKSDFTITLCVIVTFNPTYRPIN